VDIVTPVARSKRNSAAVSISRFPFDAEGLTTEEIARAFLVPEPTVAQRIVRAKRTLPAAGVAFELPPRAELAERLSVLEVIYLVFNQGYAATAGEAWMRPALCEDALRLGRPGRTRARRV
jgi:predicted RNA polymerase sigma factor